MDKNQTDAGQTVLTKEATGKTIPEVLRATDDEGTIYGNNMPIIMARQVGTAIFEVSTLLMPLSTLHRASPSRLSN